jgi:hypothetical protein
LFATLTGCVVVPLHPDGTPAMVLPAPAATAMSAPMPLTLPVRLYPAKQAAAASGVVSGMVSNQLNGRGSFSLNVDGEILRGEATRSGANATQGVANAAGSKGTYASCRYKMNSPSQGSGECNFSTGAVFQLHIGG